jgi:hypothetical protein
VRVLEFIITAMVLIFRKQYYWDAKPTETLKVLKKLR